MKKKGGMRNLLIILLALVMAFTSSTEVLAKSTLQTNTRGTRAAVETKEKTFVGDGFTVKYSIDSQWGDQYTANVTITNTGSKTIENWELAYESSDDYSNIWNAKITEHSARIYNIKNAGWNQNIEPNQSVSFGFQASFSDKIDIPSTYKLLGESAVVDENDYEATFNVQSQWGTGCIMEVTLNNTSDEDIEDWSMKFDFGFEITNIWKAKIESHEGNTYSLKNCGYNSVISAGSSTTFGMQVNFKQGEVPQNPTNIVVSQIGKSKWYMDFDKEWNTKMTHADSASVVEARKKNKNAIKVGLIDSGVSYSTNVNVVERENFVTGYEETNPLFDDVSGHGTAIAGLMASDPSKSIPVEGTGDSNLEKLMNEKIEGTDPYIQIYSARVLDEENEAKVSNIIDAINWAIDENVSIINLSCGVDKDVPALHEAIKKAYDKGILIIAAAGNDTKVEYPAKYDEVMAVGSVKSTCKQANDSATGDKIEVVAPGQDVTSYGPFGILDNFSGSSMAAPQVTALAAILWQQDLSKSNEFIRQLIDVSANNLGDKSKYGYGLIDCANALQKYSEFSSVFVPSNSMKKNVDGNLESGKIEVNDNSLLCVDEDEVKGYWKPNEHRKMGEGIEALKYGCMWPDQNKPNNKKDGKKVPLVSGVSGMVDHPEFHGYNKANYVEAYIFMTQEAQHIYGTKKGEVLNSDAGLSVTGGQIRKTFEASFAKGITAYSIKSKKDKAYFAYGMALHTLADIFAHSTYGFNGGRKGAYKKGDPIENWKKIKHGPKYEDGPKKGKYKDNKADDINTPASQIRYTSAVTVVQNVVANVVSNHALGSATDFVVKYDIKADAQTGQETYKVRQLYEEELYEGTDEGMRENYVENAYGITGFGTYIGETNDKDLNEIIANLDNDNIMAAIKAWK